jgi:ribosomal protein S18 acetylase RimI-like enzyme
MPVFRYRDASAEDLALTYEITKDAMRGYVEVTWGAWDDSEQSAKHRENFTPATHKIIMVEDEVAGFLATENLPDNLWLVKVYLFSAFRSKGIGSQVVAGVIEQANSEGKPVRLRVLRVNTRARALYERLGFKVVEQTPERFFMERAQSVA